MGPWTPPSFFSSAATRANWAARKGAKTAEREGQGDTPRHCWMTGPVVNHWTRKLLDAFGAGRAADSCMGSVQRERYASCEYMKAASEMNGHWDAASPLAREIADRTSAQTGTRACQDPDPVRFKYNLLSVLHCEACGAMPEHSNPGRPPITCLGEASTVCELEASSLLTRRQRPRKSGQ